MKDNSPIWGCFHCNTTAGRNGCEQHKDRPEGASEWRTDPVELYRQLGLANERIEILHLQLMQESHKVQHFVKMIANILGAIKPLPFTSPAGLIYDFHPPDDIVRVYWETLSKAVNEAIQTPPPAEAAKGREEEALKNWFEFGSAEEAKD